MKKILFLILGSFMLASSVNTFANIISNRPLNAPEQFGILKAVTAHSSPDDTVVATLVDEKGERFWLNFTNDKYSPDVSFGAALINAIGKKISISNNGSSNGIIGVTVE